MTVGDSVGMVFPSQDIFWAKLTPNPPGPGLSAGEGFPEGALHSTLLRTHRGGFPLFSENSVDQAQRQH